MSEHTGLTTVQRFVLRESEGDVPLPEIADAWVDGGQRVPSVGQAVPALAEALTGLAAGGLVQVRRFTTWPLPWDGGVPVEGDRLGAEAGVVATWLPGPARSGLLVARRTDEERR
ncbi:hypothetical protein [Micromonospora halophytica]|uniref:Uncharacterized protein n=1 Tax=Micromonospora halophytica TaxID=47864 RepID=A0A1C5HGF6_9ACTN|nr:hypothetical protein [Micromonospora halophytica]SCG45092.1 hypothetical protein GA0070560_104145 [Micromonospora halophytica]